MPCYLLANINVLEDDKTLLHVSFGSMSSTTIPLSKFDGESSTKDAFSDVLKSMVQKKFSRWDTPNVARFPLQTCLHKKLHRRWLWGF